MIKLDKATKIFDDNFSALDNVDLHIKKGEFVSLVGFNGAGKSTLMRLLTREIRPTSGVVMVDGVNVEDVKSKDLPMFRRKIGTIFQDFKLLASKTTFENVAFAMEVSGSIDEDITKDVPQILAIVGLRDKGELFPEQLSGGEKQRLAIARAMIHRPKILLADEPTGNLDLVNSYDVVKLLLKINEFGTTVILATHDANIVNRIDRRVVSMERGKIVRDQLSGKYVI